MQRDSASFRIEPFSEMAATGEAGTRAQQGRACRPRLSGSLICLRAHPCAGSLLAGPCPNLYIVLRYIVQRQEQPYRNTIHLTERTYETTGFRRRAIRHSSDNSRKSISSHPLNSWICGGTPKYRQ